MDQQQLRELAVELVRIPSENPLEGPVGETKGEGRLAEFVSSKLREAGIACEFQESVPERPSVLARIPGESEESVWFDAHLDTVSAEGMEFEPYQARIEGDLLYGRGAADDKGSMAAMMAALIRVARSGSKPPATVLFTATADEEYRMRGIQGLLAAGVKARVAVIGEPTGLEVVAAHKGVVRFSVITKGKAVHGSCPEAGENAIYKMAQVVRALEAYAKRGVGIATHPLLGRGTLNVGVIRGGEYVNVVPDRCVVEIDRRILPGEEPRKAVSELRSYLANAVEEVDAEVTSPSLTVPGMDLPGDHPLARAVLEAVKQVTGKAALGTMSGATHAGPLSEAQIPAVVFGPGAMGQAHTATEVLDLNQLAQAADIYELLMRNGVTP